MSADGEEVQALGPEDLRQVGAEVTGPADDQHRAARACVGSGRGAAPSRVVKVQIRSVSSVFPARSLTPPVPPTSLTVYVEDGSSSAVGARVTVVPLTCRFAATGPPAPTSVKVLAVTLAESMRLAEAHGHSRALGDLGRSGRGDPRGHLRPGRVRRQGAGVEDHVGPVVRGSGRGRVGEAAAVLVHAVGSVHAGLQGRQGSAGHGTADQAGRRVGVAPGRGEVRRDVRRAGGEVDRRGERDLLPSGRVGREDGGALAQQGAVARVEASA